MNILDTLKGLFDGLLAFGQNGNWKMLIMWAIGGILIYLAIKKEMEPTLLLPIGFGAILMNFPGVVTKSYQFVCDHCHKVVELLEGGIYSECCMDAASNKDLIVKETVTHFSGIAEPLETLYHAGIISELFPLLLFIGIGAMIDFGPLLNNPKLMIFGAAAQFGIFFTLCMASIFFPESKDFASISIIGAADGPTSIVVATKLGSNYIGAITVAAYSYMALVPIIQPPVIKLLTTKEERKIRMSFKQTDVSKTTKILFPIIISIVACVFAPGAGSLIGFLMFGNLIRECGVLESLSETAQKVLANLVTIFLGITIAFNMTAEQFLSGETLLIMGLGLVAFIVDTAGGVLFGKLYNVFAKMTGKELINPMIGAAGISAFPMSGRIVHKMALKEDPQNFLLMHSIGVNVSGQIASVIAGALVLGFFL